MLQIARKPTREILITGGAGFMGAHLASYLLATTDGRVTLVDDLADPGALQNVEWLKSQASDGRLELTRGGLRHALRVADAASTADEIYLLAGDLSSNADSGKEVTLVLLEAARRSRRDPVIICASSGARVAAPVIPNGVSVDRDSRGSGTERLVQEFTQLHHLPAVGLRMDTVTGPRQFGEPKDWVTRAEYAILSSRSCCLPGNASDEHDVLHIADAVHAALAARAYIGKTAGKAYTVGGGASRRVTVEAMVHLIERVCHQEMRMDLTRGRNTGDASTQRVDDPAFLVDTAWRPRRNLEETVREIAAFWSANREIIAAPASARRIAVRPSRVRAA